MNTCKFSSCLAAQMQRFINLRRLSGIDYHSQTRLLEYFDRFLVQQGFSGPHITREITDSYQQGLTTLAPRTQSNRMCVVRQFCEHLTGSDPQNYVPGPLKMIRSDRVHQPYIYNSRQLRALLAPDFCRLVRFGHTSTAHCWGCYIVPVYALARR